jgi:hypothetical protein
VISIGSPPGGLRGEWEGDEAGAGAGTGYLAGVTGGGFQEPSRIEGGFSCGQ